MPPTCMRDYTSVCELAQSERSDGRGAQQSKTESESAQDDDSGGKRFPKGKICDASEEARKGTD
ncbi:MAG: hypothetical protein Q9193_002152 [Seirophora villosa]